MKHLFAAIAALLLASCASAPAPARSFANLWYAPPTPGPIKSLNLYETETGWRGSVWVASGSYGFPIRTVTQSGDQLSFTVPGLVVHFSGTKDGQGWSGQWAPVGSSSPLTLQPIEPPANAKNFITLADGRRIYMDCQGTGLPAVIFDSGSGGGFQAWTKVKPEIAKTNMACTYDRASIGVSDPGPLPRDAAAVANDLDALLTAAKIPAPYVLVGHSLGGIHVRQYANTHLDKVAGMVLVDASGDNQRALFRAAIPRAANDPLWNFDEENWRRCVTILRGALLPRTDPTLKECMGNDLEIVDANFSGLHAMEHSSIDQLAASRRSYGAMPLIVLTAGKGSALPPPYDAADQAAFDKVWADLQRDQASLSTIGERRVVAGAGHAIQFDAPQAVITAIRDVLAAVKQ